MCVCVCARARIQSLSRLWLSVTTRTVHHLAPLSMQFSRQEYRIQEAWGWCTGMPQRDGMRREVGGGVQDGEHVTPVADAC